MTAGRGRIVCVRRALPPVRRCLTCLLVVAMVAFGGAGSASAWEEGRQRHVRRINEAPGLVRDIYRVDADSGPSDVQVLRFRLDDTRLALKTELANGVVPGKEAVPDLLRRLGPGAIAGVNGGFSNPSCPPTSPDGDPCGLVLRDGLLVSEDVANGSVWQGAFAIFPPLVRAEPWAVGRPGFHGELRLPDGRPVRLHGVDRQPRPGEVVAFNRAYDATTGTPPGTLELVLPGVDLGARTDSDAVVTTVTRAGNSNIPARGTVLAAEGAGAAALGGIRVGDRLHLRVLTTPPEWEQADQAMAAGPLVLRNGTPTSPGEWRSEGFAAPHHLPHPRTVIGFTPAGEALLVTVDGRRPDSRGLTTLEVAHLMQHLGAVDALMMDGGGSTTMAVRGQATNVPCTGPGNCGRPRPVASALVVWSNVPAGLLPELIDLPGPPPSSS
ncbi:MAG: phosphodiester glycosidase family protein [Actinomycetota bacterium]|nr:phosphodiester glycosidase family protein [Actinomycetota bacterium]